MKKLFKYTRLKSFDQTLSRVELVHALHFIGAVILSADAQGFCLHPQIRVLRHQHHDTRRFIMLQRERDVEDPVIRAVFQKRFIHLLAMIRFHRDANFPQSVADRNAFR